MIIIGTFITGLIMGIIFGLLNFPIPAPNTLAGILGVIGIFIGYFIIRGFYGK